jgi:hypothetical protein
MTKQSILIGAIALGVGAFSLAPTSAAVVPAGVAYALKGGRIHTVAGAAIDNGTVVIRNGVIEDVGASVAVPPDAIVVDAAGLNVYPGLIDMANDAAIQADEPAAGSGAGGRGGGRTSWRRRISP